MSVHDYNDDKTPREHLAGVLGTVPMSAHDDKHARERLAGILAARGDVMPAKTLDLTCANCGHAPVEHHAGKGYCHRCPPVACCPKWEPKTKEAQDAVHGVNYL